jgi:hypothetical protein
MGRAFYAKTNLLLVSLNSLFCSPGDLSLTFL